MHNTLSFGVAQSCVRLQDKHRRRMAARVRTSALQLASRGGWAFHTLAAAGRRTRLGVGQGRRPVVTLLSSLPHQVSYCTVVSPRTPVCTQAPSSSRETLSHLDFPTKRLGHKLHTVHSGRLSGPARIVPSRSHAHHAPQLLELTYAERMPAVGVLLLSAETQ